MPANTTVTWFPLLTQRNKALWGEDADEFKPERWLNPETQTKCNTHMGMFLPFSHGPRIVSTQSPPFFSLLHLRALLTFFLRGYSASERIMRTMK